MFERNLAEHVKNYFRRFSPSTGLEGMARPVQLRERAQFQSAFCHSDIRGLVTCRSMVAESSFSLRAGIYFSSVVFSKIAESCTYVLSISSIHFRQCYLSSFPHTKHASSLAPAVVDMFLFFL